MYYELGVCALGARWVCIMSYVGVYYELGGCVL